MKPETGPQYKKDDPFKARARLHQSKFRAEILQVAYDEYGNRLCDKDAKNLLNYYPELNCREVLRQRYPGYSKKRDADMLRSEHIPFNLLAPFLIRKDLGLSMIQNNDVDEFVSVTLFPEGNKHFHEHLPHYIEQLKPEFSKTVLGCTFETFINFIRGDQEVMKWKQWLERRYLVG